jgi:hypothetical protein
MHTQLQTLLLFSRLNAAQHVSGNILPIIGSTSELRNTSTSAFIRKPEAATAFQK